MRQPAVQQQEDRPATSFSPKIGDPIDRRQHGGRQFSRRSARNLSRPGLAAEKTRGDLLIHAELLESRPVPGQNRCALFGGQVVLVEHLGVSLDLRGEFRFARSALQDLFDSFQTHCSFPPRQRRRSDRMRLVHVRFPGSAAETWRRLQTVHESSRSRPPPYFPCLSPIPMMTTLQNAAPSTPSLKSRSARSATVRAGKN